MQTGYVAEVNDDIGIIAVPGTWSTTFKTREWPPGAPKPCRGAKVSFVGGGRPRGEGFATILAVL